MWGNWINTLNSLKSTLTWINNSHPSLKEEIKELKSQLDDTWLLFTDGDFPWISRPLQILRNPSSDISIIKTAIQSIWTALAHSYVKEFIDENWNITSEWRFNITENTNSSIHALKIKFPWNNKVIEIENITKQISKDFIEEQDPSIKLLKEKALKALLPLIVNILLSHSNENFNALKEDYDSAYGVFLLSKETAIQNTHEQLEAAHAYADFRKRIESIQSSWVYWTVSFQDISSIRNNITKSTVLDDWDKAILLNMLHAFEPILNVGTNKNQLLEAINANDSFSVATKIMLESIIWSLSVKWWKIDGEELFSRIDDSSLANIENIKQYIIWLEISNNIKIEISELKNAIDIWLEQLKRVDIEDDKPVTLVLNQANWSQRFRRSFWDFIEHMSARLHEAWANQSIVAKLNNETHEYEITFKATQEWWEFIPPYENALWTLTAFKKYLDTQEIIAMSWLSDRAWQAVSKWIVAAWWKLTWNIPKKLLIDYPGWWIKGPIAWSITVGWVELPSYADLIWMPYFWWEIDEWEFALRMIIFWVIPAVFIWPAIWDAFIRADSGLEAWEIQRIRETLRELQDKLRKRWNDDAAKRIWIFLDDAKKIYPESSNDSIEWIKDPYKAKKIVYRLLNKHFSEYQWWWKWTLWLTWDILDRRMLNKKSNTDPNAKKRWLLMRGTFFLWRTYMNLMLVPLKIINRWPSRKPIDLWTRWRLWTDTRVLWWWIQLKDTAILAHWSWFESQLAREQFIADKLALANSDQGLKKGIQAELARIESWDIPFTDYAPHLRSWVMHERWNINNAIAELFEKYSLWEANETLTSLNAIDKDFNVKMNVLRELDENFIPDYLTFITGNSKIDDPIERQLVSKIREFRYSSSSVADFQVKMAHVFWNAISKQIWYADMIRIARNDIWVVKVVDQETKSKIIGIFETVLLNDNDWNINKKIPLLQSFLWEWRNLSERHICYAMCCIAKGIPIWTDDLLDPWEVKTFLSTHTLPETISGFKGRPNTISNIKGINDNDFLVANKSSNIDLSQSWKSHTNITLGWRKQAKTRAGKAFAKMKESDNAPIRIPLIKWRHSVFRNSKEIHFDKLTDAEKAIDYLSRLKLHTLISTPNVSSDKIHIFTTTIDDIKNWDAFAVIKTLNAIDSDNFPTEDNLPTWSEITGDLQELSSTDIEKVIKRMWKSGPQVDAFRKSVKKDSWRIDPKNVQWLLKLIYSWLK